MIIEALVLGLIIGFFKNGRWYNLMEIEFHGWYLIFLGAALQIIPIAATKLTERFIILQWAPFIGLCLIWIAVLMNWRLKGFKLLALGALLNLVAMAAHSGKMPIHLGLAQMAGINALVESVKSGTVANLMSLEDSTNILRWLGKAIPIPKPYPLAKMISIGDLLMTIGIVYFIQGEMVYYHFRSKGKMLKFSIRSKF